MSVTRYFILAAVFLSAVALSLPFCHSTQVPHPLRMAMVGYILSLVVELPVLILALSASYKLIEKVLAGLWLTACTYPAVSWLFSGFIQEPVLLTFVREAYAAFGEAFLFWLAFVKLAGRTCLRRDILVVILANVLSFLFGELLKSTGVIWTILEWFRL